MVPNMACSSSVSVIDRQRRYDPTAAPAEAPAPWRRIRAWRRWCQPPSRPLEARLGAEPGLAGVRAALDARPPERAVGVVAAGRDGAAADDRLNADEAGPLA